MSEYFAFQWHITNDCDQRCKHCYIFSENNCKSLDAMNWEQMQAVEAQGFRVARDGGLYVPEGIALSMEVPDELVPYCPVCGKPMSMNLRADDTFVQDEGWYLAAKRYDAFLQKCMDHGEAVCPQEIAEQSICMNGDIGEVLQ